MPKLSATTLLARAIPLAALDRTTLIDAYGGRGAEVERIRQQIEDIQALKGRDFDSLNEA